MAIITICMGVFCHGYINGLSISKYDRIYSFAEADNWSACDTSDLVTAFRYYCKSRNLALEGSVADALTSFTTSTFNNICSTLGIDPTTLSAELKKTTEGNLGLRFLFSNTGITAYNRIFAEFLQNNDLEVGDEVDNKNIHSGKYYSDNNGNHCFLFILNNIGTYSEISDNVVEYGTYLVNGESLLSSQPSSYTFNFPNNLTYTTSLSYSADNVNAGGNDRWDILKGVLFKGLSYQRTFNGGFAICSNTDGSQLYLCTFNQVAVGTNPVFGNLTCMEPRLNLLANADNVENSDIYITTNNNTINNNTYNNNYTIIYNDGDVYYTDDDDEPLPTTPPDGGGGGGGGGEPDNWEPTTPTIPAPTNPNFPTVNLPDIDIPDLPSLNFSLGDLRNKFPFSLPFDIIAILNVLDGEPQAPHIEATVPIGKWYTWEMDFDFAEFDNYARIFRAFEFIGFCIGLAIFTVHFVKG